MRHTAEAGMEVLFSLFLLFLSSTMHKKLFDLCQPSEAHAVGCITFHVTKNNFRTIEKIMLYHKMARARNAMLDQKITQSVTVVRAIIVNIDPRFFSRLFRFVHFS